MGFQVCLEYTAERGFYLFLVIVAAVATYIAVIYGVKHTHTLPLSNKLKTLYYVNCFLFTWGCTGYMSFNVIPFTYYCKYDGVLIPVGILGGYSGYLLGLLALYAMLVERLRISFRGSSLALSNNLYYFLLFGILIEFIPLFFGALLYWIHIDESQMANHNWGLISGLCFVFTNAFFGILLLTIFARKTYLLAQMTVNATRNKSNSVSSGSSSSVSENAQTTEDLIYLHNLFQPVVKYTICALLAVLSTICANYMSFHRGVVIEVDTFDLLLLHVSLDNVDIFFNVLCLLLQFPYCNTPYYMLCNPCRKGISYIVFKKWLNEETTDIGVKGKTVQSSGSVNAVNSVNNEQTKDSTIKSVVKNAMSVEQSVEQSV
eukprot:492568_1